MGIATRFADRPAYSDSEWELRVDLAAAFRLAVHFDWHESVANHFSAAVSDDGRRFLLNPRWKHFSTLRASDLLCLDAEDSSVMDSEDAPDPSAWCIHGSVHAAVPRARVLLHCHPPYATALCGLKDPTLKPIDQNTARFFNRTAIDLDFGGIADESGEGRRLAESLGENDAMIMGNHGVCTIGETVAQAFEAMYYLERAAKTMVFAYSTGQPLAVMDDELAEKTAAGWEAYGGMATAHFEHLKSMLDKADPSYKD
jgi:ribulose-5-phosphate 4-epimerase/fuculose-1-phosphate aldolase